MAWQLGELVWPTTLSLPIEPTSRQTLALAMDWKREALFGGAAGGGKSYYLLAAALQFADWPEYRALILRRTFQQLSISEGLLEMAEEWLGRQAEGIDTVNGLPTRWKLPSGATLDFGHCQHLKDRQQYQGGAWHFVGFDELTQFLEGQYTYIAFSRQRRTVDSTIPIRVRSTSNPGGEGHDWVRQRFLLEGETVGGNNYAATFLSDGRAFIPSKIRDNPHLDADEYEQSLADLHPYERAQLMEGDWDARPPGALFRREWFPILDAMPRVRRRVRYWDLAATETKPGRDPDRSVGTLYARVDDADVDFVVEDVEAFRMEPGPTVRRIRQLAEADGKEVEIWIEQEPGSSGKIAATAIARELDGFTVRFDRPTGSKVTRSGPFASASEQGRVGVLRGSWFTDWIRELEQFPGGAHDDRVDSVSGAHGVVAVRKGVTWDDLYPPSPPAG